ncbi:hypothetical protein Cgig2_028793 [Carnegiea gigantea]|uniref:Uncharacterized protein n=1 Tax=Carnegiea gigantea TaxID=171969 RepID=A0A9Q1JLP1_9CARY|nr:hypothetical protein Cgig2_028793 [Carnegiea gigantea]
MGESHIGLGVFQHGGHIKAWCRTELWSDAPLYPKWTEPHNDSQHRKPLSNITWPPGVRIRKDLYQPIFTGSPRHDRAEGDKGDKRGKHKAPPKQRREQCNPSLDNGLKVDSHGLKIPGHRRHVQLAGKRVKENKGRVLDFLLCVNDGQVCLRAGNALLNFLNPENDIYASQRK